MWCHWWSQSEREISLKMKDIAIYLAESSDWLCSLKDCCVVLKAVVFYTFILFISDWKIKSLIRHKTNALPGSSLMTRLMLFHLCLWLLELLSPVHTSADLNFERSHHLSEQHFNFDTTKKGVRPLHKHPLRMHVKMYCEARCEPTF